MVLGHKMPCFCKKFFATSRQGRSAWRGTVSPGSCSLTVSKSHKQGKELRSFQSQLEGFKPSGTASFSWVCATRRQSSRSGTRRSYHSGVDLESWAPIHSTKDPREEDVGNPQHLFRRTLCREGGTSQTSVTRRVAACGVNVAVPIGSSTLGHSGSWSVALTRARSTLSKTVRILTLRSTSAGN